MNINYIKYIALGLFTTTTTFFNSAQAFHLLANKPSSLPLDLINVATCYRKGYTGKGISVTVIDDVINANHTALAKKTEILNKFDKYSAQDPHGTYVAGIIAATPNDKIGGGIAFDAEIKGIYDNLKIINYLSPESGIETYELLNNFHDTTIINNSWGDDVSDKKVAALGDSQVIYSLIKKPDQLAVVWAAGNDGLAHPTLQGLTPYYFKDDIANFLSVSSIDAQSIFKDNDSKMIVSPNGVSFFTNLPGHQAAIYSVMAPGSYIPVLTDKGTTTQHGTSFAAPMVSGVLALVQQKYPFLNARQLIDTVLTTARRDFVAPDYIISHEQPSDLSAIEQQANSVNTLDYQVFIDEFSVTSAQLHIKAEYIEPPFPWDPREEPRLRVVTCDDELKAKIAIRILNPDKVKAPKTNDEAKKLVADFLLNSNLNYNEWLLGQSNRIGVCGLDYQLTLEDILNYLDQDNSWYAFYSSFDNNDTTYCTKRKSESTKKQRKIL